MKCPICHEDHFMLCHSCPHNGQLAGMKYDESPCSACAKDAHGKQRANDSREIGHGRVVSLDAIERYVADAVPADDAGDGRSQVGGSLLDFVRRFCRLDIRTQFMFEQRLFFGRSLEEVADGYRVVFRKPMTPAGVAAALKASRSLMCMATK